METKALLDQLLDVADQLGIEIRREDFNGDGGGVYQFKGKWVLIVDTGGSWADQLDRTASGLAGHEGLDEIYMIPQLRELLDGYNTEETGRSETER